jgi:putative FmdB family regulatory protein
MPTYQYICDSCGHEFEEYQSMTEEPISACPKCQAKPRRLISGGAGILFKGSGFYQTDYRSASYKSAAGKDKDSSSSSTTPKTDKDSSSSATSTPKTESKS